MTAMCTGHWLRSSSANDAGKLDDFRVFSALVDLVIDTIDFCFRGKMTFYKNVEFLVTQGHIAPFALHTESSVSDLGRPIQM